MRQTYAVVMVGPYISYHRKAGGQRCSPIRRSVSCDLFVFCIIDKDHIIYLADFCAGNDALVPGGDDDDGDRVGNLSGGRADAKTGMTAVKATRVAMVNFMTVRLGYLQSGTFSWKGSPT